MANVTDGRRNNGGRSTKGYAGRKSAKVEENVRKAILRAAKRNPKALDRIWDKILEKALTGSEKHIRIVCDYYWGRPVENVKIEQKSMSLHVTRTIVTNEITGSGDQPAIQQKAD